MTGDALKIGKRCIHRAKMPVSYRQATGWVYQTIDREVILMAVSGRYAMVRRSGCLPYVCNKKDLRA